MVADGSIQGLRIDHIDGLFDPREYCERLQGAAASCNPAREEGIYIVVEKILARYEALPDWPIAGMTARVHQPSGGAFRRRAGRAPFCAPLRQRDRAA